MPELPEVESVRRLLDRIFVGRSIAQAEAHRDDIVFGGVAPEAVRGSLEGRHVVATGRKGKYFWLQLDEGCLMAHLGMSGWVREIGEVSEKRLVSHGKAPLDDQEGLPRHLKLLLTSDQGRRAALTDGRRLGRIWLAKSAEDDPKIRALGRDTLNEPWKGTDLRKKLGDRKAPLKALMLNQTLFAGVGNWVADEVLYHARVAPARIANSLSEKEWKKLAEALIFVMETAVEAEADDSKYPEDWLFRHRWGGSRGSQAVLGHQIRRDQVGGRTTAWVPDLQK